MAQDDSDCPPGIFGPDKPGTSERHRRIDRDRGRQERDQRDDR
jgi:hypothetical protein